MHLTYYGVEESVPKKNYIVRLKHNENTHVHNFRNVTVNEKIGTKEILKLFLCTYYTARRKRNEYTAVPQH
jgi:hypothetical protein